MTSLISFSSIVGTLVWNQHCSLLNLRSSVQHQEVALQEVTTLWKGLKDVAGRGAGARKWEEREKKKKDTVRRFSRTRDGYMEVRDGLA
jgi:hypothetical protein